MPTGPAAQADRRMEAGPMLICVDTSGSMQGGAERGESGGARSDAHRARAAARLPRVRVRRPGRNRRIRAQPRRAELAGLAQFLAQGFRGGTDICGPLERVLARLAEERWQLADLLIASDGEFGATPETAAATARAKASLACGSRAY